MLLLLLVVIMVLPSKTEQIIACAKELGAESDPNLDLISRLKHPGYKCLPKCMFEHFGMIDANGKVNDVKLTEIISYSPEGYEGKIRGCFKQYEDIGDLCERFYKTNTCINNKSEKN